MYLYTSRIEESRESSDNTHRVILRIVKAGCHLLAIAQVVEHSMLTSEALSSILCGCQSFTVSHDVYIIEQKYSIITLGFYSIVLGIYCSWICQLM